MISGGWGGNEVAGGTGLTLHGVPVGFGVLLEGLAFFLEARSRVRGVRQRTEGRTYIRYFSSSSVNSRSTVRSI